MESQHLLDNEAFHDPVDHLDNPLRYDAVPGAVTGRNIRQGNCSEQTSSPKRGPKRYRLSFLIVMSFDTTLLVFLSILCYLVRYALCS